MVLGYVLISTKTNMEKDVYRSLKKVKEIQEIYPLFGEYDLIAKIEAKDFNELGTVVIKKIRNVPGVLDTKTLPGLKI